MKKFLVLALCGFVISCAKPKEEQPVQEPVTEQPIVPVTPAPTPTPEQPKPIVKDHLSTPDTDSKFMTLSDGRKLGLTPSKGNGTKFTSANQTEYKKLKSLTQTEANYPVQWALLDLSKGTVIEQSLGANNLFFGASVSKIFVAGALLDRKGLKISDSQIKLMKSMLTVSSNEAWIALQKELGDGDANKGRQRNYEFTQKMGYAKTKGFQGSWGSKHGNELVADETAKFMQDMYENKFAGAEVQWKIMYACATGLSRARKYLPKTLYVGGKTGTYDGPTEVNGKSVKVKVRNHVITYNYKGTQYALTILANTGSDSDAALLAGGLFRQHTDYKD